MNKRNQYIIRTGWTLILALLMVGVMGCSSHSTVDSTTSSPSASSSTSIPSTEENTNVQKTTPSSNDHSSTGKGVIMIGDSVTVGVEPYIKEQLPDIYVDGKVGRQMSQAKQVIDDLAAQGHTGDRIIIELGTNGPFSEDQLRTVLQSLSSAKQVLLVTARVPKDWQNPVNDALKEVTPEFPNTKIVDWYTASEGKDDYFYNDGVHLKPDGSRFYTSLLVQALEDQ